MSISQITTTAYRQHKIIVKILTISQILAVLFLFSTTAFSQQADSRFRLGASFSADLTDRLSAGIGIEQRQRDNFHQFDKLLIEPEIKYAITEKQPLTEAGAGMKKEKPGSVNGLVSGIPIIFGRMTGG